MDDRYILERAVTGSGLYLADPVNDVHPFHYRPEDRVFAVKEVVVYEIDEELAPPVSGPAFAMEMVPRLFRLWFVNSSLIT